MRGIFIGLGSNLAYREINLARAREMISSQCRIVHTSSIYETQPLYNLDQPLFLNQVVEVETDLSPAALLSFLLEIESKMGRVRTVKNAPRIIDLDLLLYHDVILNTLQLILPHPLLQEREFVLVPLVEINPYIIHPLLNKTMKELLDEIRTKK